MQSNPYMKVNPNPKCSSCTRCDLVTIDGYSGLVGTHFMCSIPWEEMDGYTALGDYYDRFCIDGFKDGRGECKYYQINEKDGAK